MVFEGFALRTAVRHARPARGKQGWLAFVRGSRSPELPVLLVEDSAAIAGLLCALMGVVLAQVTGDPVFDGVGTLGIGVVLVVVGVFLAVEMQSLLLGEAATEDQQEAIRAAAGEVPEITEIVYVMTQHLSPDDLLVAIKVNFRAGDLRCPGGRGDQRLRGADQGGRPDRHPDLHRTRCPERRSTWVIATWRFAQPPPG